MSAAVAAGCALSSDQSVSVVPMIQCRPHGMTNSTDFSVRRISPESRADPVARARRGGCPCSPAPGTGPRSPASRWVSSVHTPVALTTCGPADVELLAGLQVVHLGADDPFALLEQPHDPGPRRARGAVRRGGAGDGHRVPGVVDLGVVVVQRADQRVLLQRRDDARAPRRVRCRWCGHAPGRPESGPRASYSATPGADVGRSQPRWQRVEERHRLDQVRGQSGCSSPRSCSASRDQPEVEHAPGSAGRRGSACSSGSRCRRRSRGPRPARRSGRGSRRRGRTRPRRRRRRRRECRVRRRARSSPPAPPARARGSRADSATDLMDHVLPGDTDRIPHLECPGSGIPRRSRSGVTPVNTSCSTSSNRRR